MVKLKNIKITSVSHPNIFVYKNKSLECIDMIFNIVHEVDRNSVNFDKYEIDKNCPDDELTDLFLSYMMVWIEGNNYKNLDNMNYDDFNYAIICDVSNDVDEIQDISIKEMKKAFNMMKEYVKTNPFKNALEREFNM